MGSRFTLDTIDILLFFLIPIILISGINNNFKIAILVLVVLIIAIIRWIQRIF